MTPSKAHRRFRRSGPRLRVLVVEDDQITIEALTETLWRAGFTVSAAVSTGEEALAQLQAVRPDIALVDLTLSDAIHGLTVGEDLAREGVGVIYMTGDVVRAVQDGRAHAADFLEKPFTMEALFAALERATHHKQHLRRL